MTDPRDRTSDTALRRRAAAVIPGGMYGHQSARPLPGEYPQFMREGRGARVWDADGNEYVDLMCSYGPVATTMCATIARAATGRKRMLVAHGAYHGAAPWCTPRPAGTTDEDRGNLGYTPSDGMGPKLLFGSPPSHVAARRGPGWRSRCPPVR